MSLQHLTEPLSGHNFDMVVTLTSDVLTWDNRHDVIVQQTTVVASDELLTESVFMGETLAVEISVCSIPLKFFINSTFDLEYFNFFLFILFLLTGVCKLDERNVYKHHSRVRVG